MIATVQVWMRADSALGPRYWRNTWEVDLGVLGFWASDLSSIAQAFGTFHKKVLLTPFNVDHVVVSTYVEDGHPYDPDTFHVEPIDAPGERVMGGDGEHALPLGVTLLSRKAVVRGRQGFLTSRGFLTTSDITSDASGVVRLANRVSLQTIIGGRFSDLQTALGTAHVCMASGAAAESVREVTGLFVNRLSARQTENRVKTRVPSTSPLAEMGRFLGDLQGVAEVMNPIITAYNALPLPDVPLLGD